MNNLQQYILDSNPEYEYRVKFACEPSKEDMSKMHSLLTDRYDAFEVSPMKRTMFQVKPLDFADIDCGEIWILDFKAHRGVSTEVLLFELGNLLKWSESMIRVRSSFSPAQMEIAKGEDDIDFDEEYTTRMTDNEYKDSDVTSKEAQELVGQARADAVVDAAKAHYKKDRTPYMQYMAAGFGKNKE